MKRSALLLLAASAPAVVSGQSPNPEAEAYLDSVRQGLPALATAAYEWHDSVDLSESEGSAEFSIYEARAPFAAFRPTAELLFALSLDWTMADLEVEEKGVLNFDGELHGLYLPLSFSYRPGGDWYWLGQVAPGLRTDFDSVGSDDFAIRGFFAAMRRWSDTLAVGFGGYLSHDPGGTFGAPGIGFTWQATPDWLVSLIPPNLALTYQPTEEWVFQIALRPRSFKADLTTESANDPDYAEVSYGRAGFSLKRRLFASPDIWLSLSAGYTLYSEVELERNGRSLLDGETDNGFFAGAALELAKW